MFPLPLRARRSRILLRRILNAVILTLCVGACGHKPSSQGSTPERKADPAVAPMAAPSAAPASVDPSLLVAAGEQASAARAEACLADVRCSATEASGLLIAADDAHDLELNCFRFVDGAGTARARRRGRSCLEHQGRMNRSGGLLAAERMPMSVGGLGGPTGPARAPPAFCSP